MMAVAYPKLSATFCNARVHSYSVNVQNDWVDVTMMGDRRREKMSMGTSAEIDMQLLYTSEVMARLQSLLGMTSTSRHIGPAAHCRFCNRTYLPGTLSCLGCGAPTNYNPLAMEYKGAAAILRRMDYTGDPAGIAVIDITLQQSNYAYTPALFKGDLSWLVDDHPSTWLCGFCGLYVSERKTSCPGCGGYRVPEKALARLERECVYCGKPAYGGYVCGSCNGRLAPREVQ